jgi:hypothetical protein
MIVSSATAVLPVWRSPMMSSRWPRPTGIIESMAMMPVCIGSWNRLALDDAGSTELDGTVALGRDGALAVERLAERAHDAAEHRPAGRHLDGAAGGAHGVVLLDERVTSPMSTAPTSFSSRLRAIPYTTCRPPHELEQLAGHRAAQSVDAGDTVADLT